MKTQYNYAWRSLSEWCDRYDVSKTRPSVGNFTKYLWFLFRERNLSLEALKVHQSVIATIVDPLRRTPLSQHPMVSRFLEAVLLSRPPGRIVKHICSSSFRYAYAQRMGSRSRFRQTQVILEGYVTSFSFNLLGERSFSSAY